MKYCLEFGQRGGYHVDNIIIPTRKLAFELANAIAMSFEPTGCSPVLNFQDGHFTPRERITWQSDTHFVAISQLDGVDRGPASAKLWKK
jgi:hypothetical protein